MARSIFLDGMAVADIFPTCVSEFASFYDTYILSEELIYVEVLTQCILTSPPMTAPLLTST